MRESLSFAAAFHALNSAVFEQVSQNFFAVIVVAIPSAILQMDSFQRAFDNDSTGLRSIPVAHQARANFSFRSMK